MARTTIAEDITSLENERDALQTKISAQEALKSIEEGGGGARFRTDFTDITVLYQRLREIKSKLEVLYAYSDRGTVYYG